MHLQLAACPLTLCASPDYVAQHGTPKRPEDLMNHNRLVGLNPRVDIFIGSKIASSGYNRVALTLHRVDLSGGRRSDGLSAEQDDALTRRRPERILDNAQGGREILIRCYERRQEAHDFPLQSPLDHQQTAFARVVDHVLRRIGVERSKTPKNSPNGTT